MRRAVLAIVLALAAWCAASASAASGLRFAPVVHRDANDVPGGALDLVKVTFGQQDAQLLLHVETARDWRAGDLDAKGGRTLCVVLRPGGLDGRKRLCVVGRNGRPGLRLTELDGDGNATAVRDVPALIGRPDERTIDASISPFSVGLPLGAYSWSAESQWVDGSRCAAPGACDDTFPDAGAVPDRRELLAGPDCFGAASRDPETSCRNPLLRLAVVPTPDDAIITPNAYCHLTKRFDLISPCDFGVSGRRVTGTVAIVGDSHAGHWRGALEVVAQAKGWHGISVTRSSCPLTRAQPISPKTTGARRNCRRWNDEVLRWFRQHPEIHTVFVSNHATVRTAKDPIAGYRAAWRRLPSSVKRIVVLRDNPEATDGQPGCVSRRIAQHRSAVVACAHRRSVVLHPDPQVRAARGQARVHVIDLIPHMCGPRLCFPVVGGALVQKDKTHMTRVFATTLGPYVLRAYDRLFPAG